ncbi:MAG TPA: hypothetical protein VJX92_03680 [Methylomirabilota bacterium]|nr:hypothetical protein [Methylomirabilota bacterium]
MAISTVIGSDPGAAGQLNHELVTDAIARLRLPRLTIDVDGTVVRTGATVAGAFRGFNPHHRKDPSYYPLLAHLAQTGHIPAVQEPPRHCARFQASRGVPP